MKKLAVLPHYDAIPADDFATEYPTTAVVGINLNQYNPTELKNSVSWAIGLGKKIMAAGRKVVWSVPYPGAKQMELVNDGSHDDLYRSIADQLLTAEPGTDPIYVRLPWEFNLWGNTENRMLNKAGNPDLSLGIRSWRRIAMIFRSRSSRFKIIWSPSVERSQVVDAIAAWPGVDYVDYILPDLYMAYTFGNKPGDYTGGWFREPLLKLREFAYLKGKPFGLGEFGVDHDDFAADVQMVLDDVMAAKNGWLFIMWWNDFQVVDCRITAGLLPKIAAIFKKMFTA